MPDSGWDMDLGRLRDLFEREIIGARPEDADRDHDDHHGEGDEGEHPARAEILQEEGDHEAREHGRDAAERIDEADRSGSDAGGEQLCLIGVIGIGQQVVGRRDQAPEDHHIVISLGLAVRWL